MLKKMPLLSLIVVAATIVPGLLNQAGQAELLPADRGAGSEWGNTKHWGASANVKNPGSSDKRAQELMKHDDLLPGQNRTQAMRLEAETGHLNPDEDAIVDKAIKQDRDRDRVNARRASARRDSHSHGHHR